MNRLSNYLFSAMVAIFFCSCTTHRNVCGVTLTMGDSLTQYIEQTASVEKQDSSTTQSTTVSNSFAVESSTSAEEDVETVTEYVVEYVDTTGATVRNTSRTITRTKRSTESTQQSQERSSETSIIDAHFATFDSVYDEYIKNIAKHWEDSAYIKEEKDTNSTVEIIGVGFKVIMGTIILISIFYVIEVIKKLIGKISKK